MPLLRSAAYMDFLSPILGVELRALEAYMECLRGSSTNEQTMPALMASIKGPIVARKSSDALNTLQRGNLALRGGLLLFVIVYTLPTASKRC